MRVSQGGWVGYGVQGTLNWDSRGLGLHPGPVTHRVTLGTSFTFPGFQFPHL